MSSDSHIKILLYSSSHLTERHTVLSTFMKELDIIPDKSIMIRAVGGKKLDESVLYNVEEDIRGWPNAIVVFLLGDNNLRDKGFHENEYIGLLERLFNLQSRLDRGLIVWNGLIPNPLNWENYQKKALVLDQRVESLSKNFRKVVFVNLKSQFRENQWVSEHSILRQDGVHLNEYGGPAMARLLANEIKASVARIRLNLSIDSFRIFERKIEKDDLCQPIRVDGPKDEIPKFEKQGCVYAHLADGSHVSRETNEKFSHGCFAGSLEKSLGALSIVKKEFVFDYSNSLHQKNY